VGEVDASLNEPVFTEKTLEIFDEMMREKKWNE